MMPIYFRHILKTSTPSRIACGLALAALTASGLGASSTPLGTSAPNPQRSGQATRSEEATQSPSDQGNAAITDTKSRPRPRDADSEEQAKTCASPQFTIQKWEGDSKGDEGGWPRVLVLGGTSNPQRTFSVQVCLPTPNSGETKDGWSFGTQYPAQGKSAPLTHPMEHCYNAETNVTLAPASDSSQPRTIRISFSLDEFRELLAADGVVLVGYQTDDPCSLHWDQVPLTVFNRNVVKLQAGLLYRLNDAGSWDSSGEAALRFTSRFTSMFEGETEFRYDGIASSKSAQSSTPQAARKDVATGSSTFNPFSSSKGTLQMNMTQAGYIFGRGTDLINLSWIAGAGLTTLRAASAPSAAAADVTSTSTRYFGGLRLVVPSFFSDGVALVKPHSRLQISLAHDDIWKTMSAEGMKVDKSNRIVTEGDFEFLQAKQNEKSNVLVGVHFRWDAPASFGGGTSDLRIALLTAVNFFGF